MDYERKYNELVEAARAVVEGNPGLCDMNKRLSRVRDLLPEKENEDERIRKEILEYFNQFKDKGLRGVNITSWITYLEKQKDAIGAARQRGYEEGLEDGIKMNMAEQMGESKEWADELSAEIDRISKRYPEMSFAKLSRIAVHFIKRQKEQKPFSSYDMAKCFIEGQDYVIRHPEKFELQKPKEWSEEDKKLLDFWLDVIDRNDWRMDENFCKASREFINRLKSLRHQPHWKPSQEQMESLREAGDRMRTNEAFALSNRLVSLYYDLKKL